MRIGAVVSSGPEVKIERKLQNGFGVERKRKRKREGTSIPGKRIPDNNCRARSRSCRLNTPYAQLCTNTLAERGDEEAR